MQEQCAATNGRRNGEPFTEGSLAVGSDCQQRSYMPRAVRCCDIAPWSDRVRLIDPENVEPGEGPVLGSVAASIASLLRADGYVAWLGDGTNLGLPEALTT